MFIKRCIELTGKGLVWAIRMLYRVILKPRAFIKVRPACLIAFIALNGFAVALVLFLTYFISEDSWSFRLLECSGPRAAPPPLLQIQVLGGGESAACEVVVTPERDQRVDELVEALRQIQQALENDDGSVSNVVVDPKDNPWIDKLINALRDAGERQSGAPVAGTNPISSVVVLRDKNPWIDDLLTVLRSAVETQVTDATVREYIEKQGHCADGENSSAERPASEVVGQDVVGKLNDINSNLTDINKQFGSQREWGNYPNICDSGEPEWLREHIMFDHNSAVLDSKDKEAIKTIARLIKEKKDNSLLVVVEGRADPSGRYLYNKELAERRADAVQNQLQMHSVSATVIVPQGELVLSREWLHKNNNERRGARVGTCKKTENRPDST